MPGRALVIQHVAFEDLGTIEPALRAARLRIEIVRAGVDALDSRLQRAADLLVVLGAPIGVYEHHTYPFLKREIELIGRRLERAQPTLGICLGAQLMAAALGAKVFPGGAGKEIGWSALTAPAASPAGNPLAPLLRPGVQVLHWHGDTFELPTGATALAGSERYSNQAFALGAHALALQFHAEVQSALLERWYIGHAAELTQAGIDIPALRAAGRRFGPRLQRAAVQVWSPWLAAALKRRHAAAAPASL